MKPPFTLQVEAKASVVQLYSEAEAEILNNFNKDSSEQTDTKVWALQKAGCEIVFIIIGLLSLIYFMLY